MSFHYPGMVLSLLLLLISFTVPVVARSPAETLILFEPSVPETPESIVFDRFDNAYITLALTGEIRKVTRGGMQTSLSFLPIGAPCGSQPTVALGLTIDRQDRLFVAIAACDPANQGVFEVDTDSGDIMLVANAPSFVVWNGIDVHRRVIYAADSFEGRVWRLPLDGGAPEIWIDDPLLKVDPTAIGPGPNGLRVFRREVYVAVSSRGTVVAIPIMANGSAGTARVHAELPPGLGCDEFAIDVRGSLYCTTDPTNIVIRLDPDGGSEILLTAADGLDGPTSASFGRRGKNRKNLFITNAAFPMFTTTFRPSLMRLRLDVPGAR